MEPLLLAEPISQGSTITLELLTTIAGALGGFLTAWTALRGKVEALATEVKNQGEEIAELKHELKPTVSKLEKWRLKTIGADQARGVDSLAETTSIRRDER